MNDHDHMFDEEDIEHSHDPNTFDLAVLSFMIVKNGEQIYKLS